MASKEKTGQFPGSNTPQPPQQYSSPNGVNKSAPKKTVGYQSEGVDDNDIFELPGSDWQLVGFLTAIAAAVRLFRIYQPSSVVFDEVHFGGFASKYIKGKFFMDVHPPLAKLLITLAGWLGGFDGEFDFKDIGKDYLGPGVPYVAMRLVAAVCGILTIPTIFLTLKATGCRSMTAALGAGLLILENGLLTQSRLILLDAPLVCFTALTALCWTCFTNQHELGPAYAFSPTWWFWLVSTGITLGATLSVKWVGLFTVAWIGSLTLVQLWVLLGDTKTVTPRLWFKHFFARAFCLIFLPLAFYMGMFGVHFICLVNPGDGDGFMSSEFQSTLNHKGMQDVPVDVVFGSRISLKHHNTQGGYLHSHNHMYPTGSKQQQITLYPHKDENNVWILENQTFPEIEPKVTGPLAWDKIDATQIKDGDIIRLYHITTHRRLHSHDHKPPVSEAEWQKEVSAYGYEGFEGDANDFFRIQIVKSLSEGAKAKEVVRTIQTKFKLVHVMSGCVLFSHKVKLPEWGFEQQEVTCATQGTQPNAVWYIETNEHPQLGADAEKVNYHKPGFFGKFWELHKVMWLTNAGLVESHAWDSRPPSWPLLKRGINFWGKDNRQIYLIGNPIVWWSSSLAIGVYALIKGFAVLRWQRSFEDYKYLPFKRFDYEVGSSVLGWAFHYFPFYLMARQLFLHHYFPALYFAIISLCQIYDFIFRRFTFLGLPQRPAFGYTAAVVFLALSGVAFTLFAPLSYGNMWTKEECNRVKVFDSWDWDCNNFLNTYDDYAKVIPQVDSSIPVSSAPVGQPAISPPPQSSQQVPNKMPGPPPERLGPPPEDIPRKVINQEKRVEYRDDKGRILNQAQVRELQGKVKFETKYETRTRILDANGKEIYEGPVENAPPHPDVEGSNPETPKQDSKGEKGPASADAEGDIEAEKRVVAEEKKAKPASDGNEATESA